MGITFEFAYEPSTAALEPEPVFVTADFNWAVDFCTQEHCLVVTQEDLRSVGLSETFLVGIVWGHWTKPFTPEETMQWATRWLELWQQPTGNERIEWMKAEWQGWEEFVIDSLRSLIQLTEEAKANQKNFILMIT